VIQDQKRDPHAYATFPLKNERGHRPPGDLHGCHRGIGHFVEAVASVILPAALSSEALKNLGAD